MSNMRLRRTVYENHVMQTEAYGSHSLELPLDSLFDQAVKKTIAGAINYLVVRDVNERTKVETLLLELGLTVDDFNDVKGVGGLLPNLPMLNQRKSTFEVLVPFIKELANEQGIWRKKYDKKSSVAINKHVEKLSSRCETFAATTANQFGFMASKHGLSDLARCLQNEFARTPNNAWTPVDTKYARETAECLKLADKDASAGFLMRLIFRRRFRKDECEYVEQLYRTAEKLVAKRRQQLSFEACRAVIRRMLDKHEVNSIPYLIHRYEKLSQNLLGLAKSVRASIELPRDTATSTHVVKDVGETLAGETTSLFEEFKSAFTLAGCSEKQIAIFLSKGFQLNGNKILPTHLANMPVASTTEVVVEAIAPMFASALDFVKRIDLTLPQLQLTIANLSHSWIQKSQPYLRFPKFGVAVENRENYLFCNTALRHRIEEYCQGRIHFSNDGEDLRYSIASTHSVALLCTVLGAGHARRNYMRGLYCRSELKGRGEFISLFEENSERSRPLAISHRPDCMVDCEQLFEIALELGFVICSGGSKQLYICNPLDATIYKRFSGRRVRRRPIAKTYLRRLISQQWFISYSESVISNLPTQWHAELLDQSPQLSDQQIGDKLTELGVLCETAGQYMFGKRFSPGMPMQDFLFFQRREKAKGLTRDSFLNSMYQRDDLYTRILVDVVMATAEGRIELHRLPEFAQRVARYWRD